MSISYNKLINIFKEKGITSYTIKKDNVIGQASWKKIHDGGDIDTRTISNLCKYLECQPGDILEYVSDKNCNDCEYALYYEAIGVKECTHANAKGNPNTIFEGKTHPKWCPLLQRCD